MLVATRDHEPRLGHGHPGYGVPRSRLSRFTGAVQLLGSLVAIPIGVISAYSVYHSNFSAEASCQGLRANIIGMLDRKADAATLRALVRRDLVSFERDCATFDADAVAAFKTLLAEPAPARRAPVKAAETKPAAKPGKSAEIATTESAGKAPAAAKAEVKAETKAETKSESKSEPKIEPKLEAAQKSPALATARAEPGEEATAVAVRRDAPEVDARWLASVREVLQSTASPAPVAPPAVPAPEPSSAQPSTAQAAPALPPPDMVRAAPSPADAMRRVERADDHPVPPALIPNVD